MKLPVLWRVDESPATLLPSGDTADSTRSLRRLIAREPEVRVGAVGVSIGGNVLLKGSESRGLGRPRPCRRRRDLRSSISAPARTSGDRVVRESGSTPPISCARAAKGRRQGAGAPVLRRCAAARRARTFAVRSRGDGALFGFADAQEYWRRASSRVPRPPSRAPRCSSTRATIRSFARLAAQTGGAVVARAPRRDAARRTRRLHRRPLAVAVHVVGGAPRARLPRRAHLA